MKKLTLSPIKKLIIIPIIVATAIALWALPSPNLGNVTVTCVRGYDTNFPGDSYFSGQTLYLGQVSGVVSQSIFLSGTNYTQVVGGLTRGSVVYFWFTQTGTNGVESDFGPITSYFVPHKPPTNKQTVVLPAQ